MPLHNAIMMDKRPINLGHGSTDKYQVNNISLLCKISTYVVCCFFNGVSKQRQIYMLESQNIFVY